MRLIGELSCTDEKTILEEERMFYKNLYSAKGISDDSFKSLENLQIPCVSSSHNDALVKDISEEECFEAICTFPNGKTPGTDGLPAEFYIGLFGPRSRHCFAQCLQNVTKIMS